MLLEQSCSRSDSPIKLVTICQQLVPNLFQQIRYKQCEYILSTTCEQLVTTCFQVCIILCLFACVTNIAMFHFSLLSMTETIAMDRSRHCYWLFRQEYNTHMMRKDHAYIYTNIKIELYRALSKSSNHVLYCFKYDVNKHNRYKNAVFTIIVIIIIV